MNIRPFPCTSDEAREALSEIGAEHIIRAAWRDDADGELTEARANAHLRLMLNEVRAYVEQKRQDEELLAEEISMQRAAV